MKALIVSLFIHFSALIAFSQDFGGVLDFAPSYPQNGDSQIEMLLDGGFVHCDGIGFEVDIDPGVNEWIMNQNEGGVGGFILTRFNGSGSVVWSNFIHYANTSNNIELLRSTNDELIVSGNFIGEIDFDPGEGVYAINSGMSADVFVASYSIEGQLNWAYATRTTNVESSITVKGIATDQEGNILVTGNYRGVVDCDPDDAEVLITASDPYIDCYLLKLNAEGDLIFANGFNGLTWGDGFQIATDSNSDIVLRGMLDNTTDLDPGEDVFVLENASGSAEYLAKYSSNGDLLWAFLLPYHYEIEGMRGMIVIDDQNNVIIGGTGDDFGTESYEDYDPGIDEAYSVGEYYWFIAKYGPDGTFDWLKSGYGGSMTDLDISSDGYIYSTGIAHSDLDLDGGPGVYNPLVETPIAMYCAKYDLEGNFIWGFGLESELGSWSAWATDIEIDNDNNLVLAGLYQGDIDIDSGEDVIMLNPAPGSGPLFIATYSQGICGNTSMIITEAQNLSCDDYSGTLSAAFVSGTEPFTFQWSTGQSTSTIEAQGIGIYTVYGIDGNGCEVERDVIVSGPSTPDNFDLNPNAMAWNFVPGFDTQIQLDAFNEGCTYATGSLILTLDPALTLLNVTPPADNINGNIITWNFADLEYDGEHLTPVVLVNTPVETPLGDIMNISVEMTPSAGDYNADNNIKNYEYEVVGSYDPNIIEVYPKGTGEEGYINANETMTYTIHFQNTGTAAAVNIDVVDVIDDDLNINTVQVIGSSHAMHTEVENGNTLRFIFNDIMLPDSTSNEPESHGYVIYTIEQLPNLLFFTQMENTAAIYFDFNAPVITNTVLNTIEGPDFVDESAVRNVLQLYPNPASTNITIQCGNSRDNLIQIVSMDGRQVASFRSLQNQLVYDVSDLAGGLYEVRLTDENGAVRSNRFLKK
jgi:uncharacterized repeat protein (TIGR01451 family)